MEKDKKFKLHPVLTTVNTASKAAAIAVFGLMAVFFFSLGIEFQKGLDSTKSQVATPRNNGVIVTITPVTSSVTPTNAVADQYAGWNTYSNPTYDFTIRYPSDWNTGKTSFNGSASSVSCDNFKDMLKQPCTGSTQTEGGFSIEKVTTGKNIDKVEFFGPANADTSTFCGIYANTNKCQVINQDIVINGTTYTVKVEKLKTDNTYSSQNDLLKVSVTGSKSKYKAFFVKVNASNDVNYADILKMIESIKPN